MVRSVPNIAIHANHYPLFASMLCTWGWGRILAAVAQGKRIIKRPLGPLKMVFFAPDLY
jgi:hypothetical protein